MKTYEFEQRSPEWYAARVGIPTASEFSKIISPLGKESTSADGYANELIAELMAGQDVDGFEGNKWTDRGKEMEEKARQYYEARYDVETRKVGFITDDDHTMGCSPDWLVGEDGIGEAKCLAGKTIVALLLPKPEAKKTVDKEFYPQVQGQLFITGRKWCDQVIYHPKVPKIIIRIPRDEEYIALMKTYMEKFQAILAGKRNAMITLGHMKG